MQSRISLCRKYKASCSSRSLFCSRKDYLLSLQGRDLASRCLEPDLPFPSLGSSVRVTHILLSFSILRTACPVAVSTMTRPPSNPASSASPRTGRKILRRRGWREPPDGSGGRGGRTGSASGGRASGARGSRGAGVGGRRGCGETGATSRQECSPPGQFVRGGRNLGTQRR